MSAVPALLRLGAGVALALMALAAIGAVGAGFSQVGAVVLLATPWLVVAWFAAQALRNGRRTEALLAGCLLLLAVASLVLTG